MSRTVRLLARASTAALITSFQQELDSLSTDYEYWEHLCARPCVV